MQSSSSLTASFDVLKSHVFPKHGISHEDFKLEHVQAILHDAFKNGSIQESIFSEDDYIAHESLARPKDENGRIYSIGNIAKAFYKAGLHVEFDTLTSSIGLKHAKKFPVTLNISVESALSPKFWDEIKKRTQHINPEDIIFEILEHDIAPRTDISVLEARKAEGFRFALDDFSIGKDHDHRLQVLGGLVDYIKIDGPLVRAYLEGTYTENHDDGTVTNYTKADFEDTVAKIQNYYEAQGLPMPLLIAERVRTREEAQDLFDIGFSGVQGWKLQPEDFHYTPEAQALANRNSSCEYAY